MRSFTNWDAHPHAAALAEAPLSLERIVSRVKDHRNRHEAVADDELFSEL